ncbi:glycoside hydrolase family 43 protein [Pedobacter sp. CG_S7]|uniref:glycoside hydrolase family 43 protein n=1 Tax=Pedobacter sp. CG_S7 TaxID=3143930 RepID=UPI003399F5B9
MNIKSIIVILLLQAFVLCSKGQSSLINTEPSVIENKNTFTNPLLTSGPDPWVIQKNGFYYYMHTLGNRIVIYKTKTLSKLNNATKKIVYSASASGPDSRNIWAPELHFLNNKWYLYYTAGSSGDLATQRMFVLENSNEDPLQGAWVNKGQIKDDKADFFAIDATVFSKDGTNYIIWSGHISKTDNTQRLFIAKLSLPWKMATSRVEIATPTYEWEKIGSPDVNEGPEILISPKGKVFLLYSASGCWTDDYSLGMMSLKNKGNPMNPADWTKSSLPVFTKKPENGAYGPGHNGFFKSPDGKEDWIIYHANAEPDLKCNNERSPRMQKFTWNADGTPNFGEPVKINTPILNPSGE